jgi:proteasome lid subunit RPN8/RPN11
MHVELPREMVDAMVNHARREYPNEMCGLIVGDRPAVDGGMPIRWVPLQNRAASPYRYEIDPTDLLRLTLETEDADEVFWAIAHSHVRSPAVPSPTDIGLAFYPEALYVLVSLSDGEADPATGTPSVRAWQIVEGSSREVEVRVDPGIGG